MSSSPKYADVPDVGMVQISTANTNRDGTTGTYGTVYTAPTYGAVVKRIRVVAAGTTTNGMVRIFITDGSTTRLFAEIDVGAVTPSATQAVFVGEFVPDDLVLPNASWVITASTHNAEAFNVFALVGEYTS